MLKITFGTRALQATLADVEKREELLGLLAVLTSDAVITNITLRATRAISRGKFGLLPNEMREMLSGHTAHLPLGNAKIDEDANTRILELLRSSKVKTKNTVEVPKKGAQFEPGIDANTEMNPLEQVKSQIATNGIQLYLGYVARLEGNTQYQYRKEDYTDFFDFLVHNISNLGEQSVKRIRKWLFSSIFRDQLQADFSYLEVCRFLFDAPSQVHKKMELSKELLGDGRINVGRVRYLLRGRAKFNAQLAREISAKAATFNFRVASALFYVFARGDKRYRYQKSDFEPIFAAYTAELDTAERELIEQFQYDLKNSVFRIRLRDDFASEYPFITALFGESASPGFQDTATEEKPIDIHFSYGHFRYMSEKRRGRIFALLRAQNDDASMKIISVLHQVANAQKIEDRAVNIGELPESLREEMQQHFRITQFSMRIGALDGKRATDVMESEKENEITREPEIVKCWLERMKKQKIGVNVETVNAILERFDLSGLGSAAEISEINALVELIFFPKSPGNGNGKLVGKNGNGRISSREAIDAGLDYELAGKLSRGELQIGIGSKPGRQSRKGGFRKELRTI